jgi:hypothetical protein
LPGEQQQLLQQGRKDSRYVSLPLLHRMPPLLGHTVHITWGNRHAVYDTALFSPHTPGAAVVSTCLWK